MARPKTITLEKPMSKKQLNKKIRKLEEDTKYYINYISYDIYTMEKTLKRPQILKI